MADPLLDEKIRKLIQAGASDDEIDLFIKQEKSQAAGASAPVVSALPVKREETLQEAASGALGKVGGFLRGAKEGVVSGSKDVLNTFDKLNPYVPLLKAAGVKMKSGPLFKDTKTRTNMTPEEEFGEFFGRMVPGVAISLPVSGGLNPTLGPMGQKILGSLATKVATSKPFAKVASKAMQEAIEVGITTIPQEIIAGSIAESFINPEAFSDWKSALRTGALSSIGTIFNAGGAYMKAIKNAKSAAELTQIQNQLKELNDEIADTGRRLPNTPEAQAGVIEADPNRQLPTAQQVAMGKTFDAELPDPNALPAQSEAAINRINSWGKVSAELQAQIDQRIARLQDIVPKREFDALEIAAGKVEVDPIIRAAQNATDNRLWEWIQQQGGGGKGVQTDSRVSVLVDDAEARQVFGPTGTYRGAKPASPTGVPQALTIDELNDHLRVLNMASVMSEPKFKKGQRFIVPRTELKSAEEIAARATGGPIKAVDKTVQAAFKNIQSRLDDAAARGIGTLDPEETRQIVDEMLSMSRRLSRGFEIPYKPKVNTLGPELPLSKGTDRYVEGLDLPTSAKLDDPDWTDQIDPAHKRWVTGNDDPPVVDLKDMPPTVPPVQAPPVVELAENYADAVRSINIDYSPKIKGLGARTWDKIKNLKTEFYDRTWGIGKHSPESRNMLNLLSGVSKFADEFYENEMRVAVRDADGVYRGNTRVVEGASLGKSIDALKMDEIVEADAYLKASTLLDRVRKNPKFILDVPVENLQMIVNNAPQKIKDFSVAFKRVADALVDDMEATGRISSKRAAEMKDGFYAGLSRSFNESVSQNALKMRKGSKRTSLPPIQLMRDNIFNTLERNRKNAAYAKLADLADSNPEAYADVIQKSDLPTSLESVPGYTDMVEQLKRDGLTHNEATQMAAMQIPIFDQSNRTLRVFRDGQMSTYKVNEDIRRTMESLNPIEFNLLRSVLTGISAPIRTTTSLALDLSLVGPVSDTFITSARTPGFIPFVSSIEGFFHSALKSPEYFERIAAGGGYGSRFDPSEVIVYKDAKATVAGKVGDKLLHPLKWAQEIIRPLSDAARMGEYLVRRRGGESAVQAALASRRTLGDFNRVGASMRGWALYTEFGNVGIQTAGAAYEMGRNAIRELGKKNPAPLMRLMATGVAGITIPTIYFRMAAEGDEELNQYRKSDQGYRYWWTRLPFDIPGVGQEGDVVKYPKPGWWMGQVFGSSIEAALDGMDADARKRLYDGVVSQVGFNPVPLKAQQVVGYLTNTRNPLTTGQSIPITPPTQENLDPSMQGNERTSPLARTLADKLGINPFKTDYVIESAGGTFFGNIIRQAGPNPVTLEKTDVPVLGRFAVKKGAPTEGSTQFYRDLDDARKYDESFERALESGDAEKARKLQADNAVLITLRKPMEKFVKDIGDANRLIYTITMDPNISPESKREYLDNLRTYQNALFRGYAEERKSWIEMTR